MRLSHRLPQLRLRRNAFTTSGKHFGQKPARTLYELLGVRPDADSKNLQMAFRDAAKAHHPDLNPGDPDATRRFTQIVNAYGILRCSEQRDVYDQMLALERARRRTRLTRNVCDAAAVVALAVVIVGGFALFQYVSETSVDTARVVEVARKPAEVAIVPGAVVPDEGSHAPLMTARGEPAGSNSEVAEAVDALVAAIGRGDMGGRAHEQGQPDEKSHAPLTAVKGDPAGQSSEVADAVDALVAAIDRGDMGSRAHEQGQPDEKGHAPSMMANRDPASDPSGPKREVARAIDTLMAAIDRGDMGKSKLAKAVDALVAAIDRGDMRSGAADPAKNAGSHSPDQIRPASVEPRSSSSERDKSPSPEVAILDAKHDARMNAKPRTLARRPAIDRTTVGQAGAESRDLSQVALAGRNVTPCGGSCANQAPPLFGVGF
ncbi:MAG TPA: J domain-containing protein [Bradyrhizobium sp.]|nr:J domain-containing protein [Bradyrhizobium sp.]